MVYSIYQSEINQLDVQIAKLRRKSNAYLLAKLLFFGASAFFVYLAIKHFTFLNLAGACSFFAAYLSACVLDSRCQKISDGLKRKKSVCKNELAYLKGDFTSFSSGEVYINPEHEYSFDLDLFGPSSLFNRMNRCVTRKGSDRLAEKLTNLCQDKQEILLNQAAIAELADNFSWRIRFMPNRFIPDNLKTFLSWLQKNKNTAFSCVPPFLLFA